METNSWRCLCCVHTETVDSVHSVSWTLGPLLQIVISSQVSTALQASLLESHPRCLFWLSRWSLCAVTVTLALFLLRLTVNPLQAIQTLVPFLAPKVRGRNPCWWILSVMLEATGCSWHFRRVACCCRGTLEPLGHLCAQRGPFLSSFWGLTETQVCQGLLCPDGGFPGWGFSLKTCDHVPRDLL